MNNQKWEVVKTLANTLKSMKERSQMTLQQISDKSGVPLSTVNRIISGGTSEPSYQTVAAIVTAMGGDLSCLTDGGSSPAKPQETAEEKKSCADCCREIQRTEREHYDEQVAKIRHQYGKLIHQKDLWLIATFSTSVLFAAANILMLVAKIF